MTSKCSKDARSANRTVGTGNNSQIKRMLRQSDGTLAAWRRRFAGGADWSRSGLSRTSARGTDARVFDKLGRTLQEALARSEHQFHNMRRRPLKTLQAFGCGNAGMIGRINDDARVQAGKVLVEERSHLHPGERARTGREPWQGHTRPVLRLRELVQRLERMCDVLQAGAAGAATVRRSGVLREQADDGTTVGRHPGPQSTRSRRLRLAVVAKILVHRGPGLAQLEDEPLVKIISRADAVHDDMGARQQQIA